VEKLSGLICSVGDDDIDDVDDGDDDDDFDDFDVDDDDDDQQTRFPLWWPRPPVLP